MQDLPMVGDEGFRCTSTVVGYLEKPQQIYYPRGSRLGSFVRWDNARTHSVSKKRVIEEALKLSSQNTQDVLIILNRALSAKLCDCVRQGFTISQFLRSGCKFTINKTRFITVTIGQSEGFHLYLNSPNKAKLNLSAKRAAYNETLKFLQRFAVKVRIGRR